MSKVTLVPQANHSQYSSPVETVNDLNIELHLPVEAKEKLAIILFCGCSFPCFNAIIS